MNIHEVIAITPKNDFSKFPLHSTIVRTEIDGKLISMAVLKSTQNVSKDAHFEWETYMGQRQLKMSL